MFMTMYWCYLPECVALIRWAFLSDPPPPEIQLLRELKDKVLEFS